MKNKEITADRLLCPKCGTVIPGNQGKCPNPKCPSNRPLYGEKEDEVIEETETII